VTDARREAVARLIRNVYDNRQSVYRWEGDLADALLAWHDAETREEHDRAERLALRVRDLYAETRALREGIRTALNELGVPQPGYLSPVANAVEILSALLTPTPGAGKA
jgi:GGDEF domain-containing protein